MKKHSQQCVQSECTYDEEGAKEVSVQIMNAYNSGVIDTHQAAANVNKTNSVGNGQE